MGKPLENCILVWPSIDASEVGNTPPALLEPELPDLYTAIKYHVEVLGCIVEVSKAQASGHLKLVFEEHQKFVECELETFGSTKPIFTEFIAQAFCGLMSVHGRSSGRIQPLGVNYLSTFCASVCLQGLVALAIQVLRGSEKNTGKVSLPSASLQCAAQYIAGATTDEGAESILPGSFNTMLRPPFKSKDDVLFELETLSPAPWKLFWEAVATCISNDISLNIQPLERVEIGHAWTAFLQRYAKAVSPMPDSLIESLRCLDFTSIQEAARLSGVVVVPVRTIAQRSTDADAQSLWSSGPWTFEREENGKEPHIEGTASVGKPGLPLSGFTVVESCRRIQGPLAGHQLSLLGATVIRIEPPGGDPLRAMPPLAGDVSARFDALNGDKVIREINIKSETGKKEIFNLVEHAQVFIHNWAPQKAEQLGLDANHLHQRNSDIIYAYAGGFSSDAEKVLQGKIPGTDFTVQAFSGVATKIGNASGTEGGSLFTALDVLGGAFASQGIVLSLFDQLKTKKNAFYKVESSLLGAASTLAHEEFGSIFSKQKNATSTQGSSPKLVNPVREIFRTLSGMLAIEITREKELLVFMSVLDIPQHATKETEPDTLLELAQEALRVKTAKEWKQHFDFHGLASSVALEDLSNIAQDEYYSWAISVNGYCAIKTPWLFH